MMSSPSPPSAMSAPEPPSMTSLPRAAPEGVVVVAAVDPVDAVGAVVDGLAVDPGRVHGVDGAVLDGAVRLPDQQRGLVALGVRDRRRPCCRTPRTRPACRPACRAGTCSRRWRTRRPSGVCTLVLRIISSANELPSSWVRRFMPGRAGQVVEPVAVLQIGELVLEHVVERRAEQAAERVGDLGEAADPQVDVVETGDRVVPLFAQAPVLFMKAAASAGTSTSPDRVDDLRRSTMAPGRLSRLAVQRCRRPATDRCGCLP